MVAKKLGGMMAIMETPLTSNGEIDANGLRRHTSHLIEGGTRALITNGGNAEAPSMSEEERKKVLEIVIDEANGKVPVLSCTSHSSTRECIKLSRHAQDAGAEGVMVTPPYYGFYAELPDWAIFKHYEMLANAVDIQIMLYSQKLIANQIVPWEVTADMAIRLVEKFDNITCMKEVADIWKINILSKTLGNRFSPFCGNDPYLFAMMSAGAKGATISLPCVAPKQTGDFFDAWEKGDITKAYKIYNRLLPLIYALYEPFSTGPALLTKIAMKMLDIISSTKMRSTFWDIPVQKNWEANIRKALEDLGLLGK
jgi:4-hydroxy-tetrahydrodipicolinate synthase